jgi:hypothetical protein
MAVRIFQFHLKTLLIVIVNSLKLKIRNILKISLSFEVAEKYMFFIFNTILQIL